MQFQQRKFYFLDKFYSKSRRKAMHFGIEHNLYNDFLEQKQGFKSQKE